MKGKGGGPSSKGGDSPIRVLGVVERRFGEAQLLRHVTDAGQSAADALGVDGVEGGAVEVVVDLDAVEALVGDARDGGPALLGIAGDQRVRPARRVAVHQVAAGDHARPREGARADAVAGRGGAGAVDVAHVAHAGHAVEQIEEREDLGLAGQGGRRPVHVGVVQAWQHVGAAQRVVGVGARRADLGQGGALDDEPARPGAAGARLDQGDLREHRAPLGQEQRRRGRDDRPEGEGEDDADHQQGAEQSDHELHRSSSRRCRTRSVRRRLIAPTTS